MSKVDGLLDICKANLGKWTCAYYASISNQPAATFREIKKQGCKFEETSPNRWSKTMACPQCGTDRTTNPKSVRNVGCVLWSLNIFISGNRPQGILDKT